MDNNSDESLKQKTENAEATQSSITSQVQEKSVLNTADNETCSDPKVILEKKVLPPASEPVTEKPNELNISFECTFVKKEYFHHLLECLHKMRFPNGKVGDHYVFQGKFFQSLKMLFKRKLLVLIVQQTILNNLDSLLLMLTGY